MDDIWHMARIGLNAQSVSSSRVITSSAVSIHLRSARSLFPVLFKVYADSLRTSSRRSSPIESDVIEVEDCKRLMATDSFTPHFLLAVAGSMFDSTNESELNIT